MSAEGKIVVEAARQEVRKMRQAIEAAQDRPDMCVTLTMDQFGKLADLIDSLAETIDFWPEEALDDPRYWVPLGHFQRVQAQASHWQTECGRLSQNQALHDLLRF